MSDAEIVEMVLRRTATRLQTWNPQVGVYFEGAADEIAKLLRERARVVDINGEDISG